MLGLRELTQKEAEDAGLCLGKCVICSAPASLPFARSRKEPAATDWYCIPCGKPRWPAQQKLLDVITAEYEIRLDLEDIRKNLQNL